MNATYVAEIPLIMKILYFLPCLSMLGKLKVNSVLNWYVKL